VAIRYQQDAATGRQEKGEDCLRTQHFMCWGMSSRVMVEYFDMADKAGADGKVLYSHVTSKRDSFDACHHAKPISPDRFNPIPSHPIPSIFPFRFECRTGRCPSQKILRDTAALLPGPSSTGPFCSVELLERMALLPSPKVRYARNQKYPCG
jgi:hypothetical protein